MRWSRLLSGGVAFGLLALSAGVAGAHDEDPSGSGAESGGVASAASDAATGTFKARLSGLNEINAEGKGSAGALTAFGRATVHVRAQGRVCWSITAEGIDPVAAHIHKGAIGANGPVVVDFEAAFKGCKTVDGELASAIAGHPEDYYVNVHTAEFKGGAVRGQLRVEPEEFELKARLNGANEVGGGDPDGRGKLDVDLRGTLICWKFTSSGIDPVAAQHIHKGAAGVNGPVVVDFASNGRGCRDVAPALAFDLLASPAGYYGNMHTATFPGGAIRGQLAPGRPPGPAA